ncbi:hypothetical protein F4782DRAFT_312456 [Xylaria castorea]|nr:hypothetical protein F4782DRAFT_312456 [Xylaria castorea]
MGNMWRTKVYSSVFSRQCPATLVKISKMSSGLNILIITQNQEQLLRSSIVDGLNTVPETLPTVLLWDDAGHELFKQLTKSKSYHGPQADYEIMRDRVDEICEYLGDDGVLVELGAGSIPHTSVILEELYRHGAKTRYLAHDFCQKRLTQSLCRLTDELGSKYPDSPGRMRGIVGTYGQFVEWLSKTDELQGRRVVVIWLENSLSHVSDADFPDMISMLMQSISLSQAASSVLRFVDVVSWGIPEEDSQVCTALDDFLLQSAERHTPLTVKQG